MKKIFGKLLKRFSVIALILSILMFIAAVTGFFIRLFTWYKTGEIYRLAIIDFIPDGWIVKTTTTWPEIQKILLLILNQEIISSLMGFCLILILISIIMFIAAKWCEEKPSEQETSSIILNRLKKLTRNK